MRLSWLAHITTFIALSNGIYIVHSELEAQAPLLDNINFSAVNAVAQISSTKERAMSELLEHVETEVTERAKHASSKQLEKLESQVQELLTKINDLESKKTSLQINLSRANANLPALVSLDDLGKKYSNLASQYSYESVAKFDTQRGEISFNSNHVTIAKAISGNSTAWIRFGKENSTENESLIDAFIAESIAAKKLLGYRYYKSKDKTHDYGESYEQTYLKDDLYIRTYKQYTRIQGTYNSTSLEYKYFVEVGSVTRKKAHSLAQYNSNLGS